MHWTFDWKINFVSCSSYWTYLAKFRDNRDFIKYTWLLIGLFH